MLMMIQFAPLRLHCCKADAVFSIAIDRDVHKQLRAATQIRLHLEERLTHIILQTLLAASAVCRPIMLRMRPAGIVLQKGRHLPLQARPLWCRCDRKN